MTDFSLLTDEQLETRVEQLRTQARHPDASPKVIADYEAAQTLLAERRARTHPGHM